jgi:hypothetical protein
LALAPPPEVWVVENALSRTSTVGSTPLIASAKLGVWLATTPRSPASATELWTTRVLAPLTPATKMPATRSGAVAGAMMPEIMLLVIVFTPPGEPATAIPAAEKPVALWLLTPSMRLREANALVTPPAVVSAASTPWVPTPIPMPSALSLVSSPPMLFSVIWAPLSLKITMPMRRRRSAPGADRSFMVITVPVFGFAALWPAE